MIYSSMLWCEKQMNRRRSFRDGSGYKKEMAVWQKFCLDKISGALVKAFEATQMQYDQDIIDSLALRVTADIQGKMKDGSVHVEDIQDSAEKVLEQAGYTDTAKAFILYRKQRERMRNMKSTILDYKEVVDSYVKVEDWRVKENSTVTYSVGGLILSNSGQSPQTTGSEIYDEEIASAHRNADIHIHDLSMLTGYSCRLVAETVDSGGAWRYYRQDYLGAGKAFVRALQPDGQFSGNYAE